MKIIRKNFNERKVNLYSYPGVMEVIFSEEWKGKSPQGMKCMTCHRRPCICKYTL